MIRDLMIGGASVEDTLTLWASSLRDAKQRIRRCLRRSGLRPRQGSFSTDCHWRGLTRFLDDGASRARHQSGRERHPADLLDQKKRTLRRSWGRHRKLRLARIHRSIVATCKLNDENPVAYIAETLEAIHRRPSTKQNRRPHAVAIPQNVKLASIGSRLSAYG
jgi:hypothetical protein